MAARQWRSRAELDDQDERKGHGHGHYHRDERQESPKPACQAVPAAAPDGQAELRQHVGEFGIGAAQRLLDPGQCPPFGRCKAHDNGGASARSDSHPAVISVLTGADQVP